MRRRGWGVDDKGHMCFVCPSLATAAATLGRATERDTQLVFQPRLKRADGEKRVPHTTIERMASSPCSSARQAQEER